MDRELIFRQAIFKDGAFLHWHYWGFCGYRDSFVSPVYISPMGSSIEPTGYDVKDSQQYSGRRCGPVGLGTRIYEGDIYLSGGVLSSITFEDEVWWAGKDFLRDVEGEVTGNIHENPELLK